MWAREWPSSRRSTTTSRSGSPSRATAATAPVAGPPDPAASTAPTPPRPPPPPLLAGRPRRGPWRSARRLPRSPLPWWTAARPGRCGRPVGSGTPPPRGCRSRPAGSGGRPRPGRRRGGRTPPGRRRWRVRAGGAGPPFRRAGCRAGTGRRPEGDRVGVPQGGPSAAEQELQCGREHDHDEQGGHDNGGPGSHGAADSTRSAGLRERAGGWRPWPAGCGRSRGSRGAPRAGPGGRRPRCARRARG